MANISGTTIVSATSGCMPKPVTMARPRKLDSTIRSPWAMLTSRMTPKMSDRPVANNA